MTKVIDFRTDPSKYRHWRVEYDGPVANLFMDVDENGGLFDGYELKLNSYDLGVDIELNDIVQRMRFEHPEVKVVVMQSGKDKVFCAGANIRMLGGAEHSHKGNFCKFTNETRNTFEAAAADSGQNYIAAVKGACAGGGYELALACNHIMLTDDSTSAVGLPEVLDETVQERAKELAAASSKPDGAKGITFGPLERTISDSAVTYDHVEVELDRTARRATITLKGPEEDAPADMDALHAQGDQAYLLKLCRELEDAILHLRLNEMEAGLWVFKTVGDAEKFLAHEGVIADSDHWLANELRQYWKRTLKRIDVTSRSLAAFVENGSCFAGMLAEILFAVDRTYMMEGEFEGDNRPEAAITLSKSNFGSYPMGNDLTRLQTRFLGEPEKVETAKARIGEALDAEEADDLGLVTMILDDIDWEDEVRIFMEERASFSPDAMTGMEANLRFAGPETMETRIFGRLTAWQNWIFSRPNAVGKDGALQRYGTGVRGDYNMERV